MPPEIIVNLEIFISVFAALVAYRIMAPLIDALNPFAPKMVVGVRAGAVAKQGAR